MKKLNGWARAARYAKRTLPAEHVKDRPLTGGEMFGLLANAWHCGFTAGKRAARGEGGSP